MNTYEPVIGLEIHVELKTKSGMFCGCPADHFAKKPNTGTCPVCLGLPGALPVPNKKAVEWTIMLGLALGGTIAEVSKFDRKHYFYPDLPKGYQISQYDQPLCRGGKVSTSFGDVRIHRVHLEEDTGKLQHATVAGKKVTLVDFNRSGVPLVEIVTEADIHSSEQAKEFLKKLHQIVRYLGISDADMEKGSMRLEPNISIRKVGETGLPNYKVEVKNINSFRFAAAAIDYEVKRHTVILESGKVPAQETRGWDEAKNATVSQRSKEEAADYRYFPEPDIPPLRFTKEYIDTIKANMPQLPDAYKKEIKEKHGLNDNQAKVLSEDFGKMKLFKDTVSLPSVSQANISGATVANWIINKVPDTSGVTPTYLADQIIKSKQVTQVDDSVLVSAIDQVIAENPKAVADFKAGKEQSKMFLYGNVLKRLAGKGDKQKVMELLVGKL
ncbi:Asp-tRNA(Asn)/Glu-tRNA(Gln) amidotransferase subunit GatB [Candidatus Gottesmanbacteria bacterium]|nr:Asp-tRNA(Asn)/Glu-tRNA(Gln) amidotransferase subunit GatB [Candidatus Gottesmanbacteria bacterium]